MRTNTDLHNEINAANDQARRWVCLDLAVQVTVSGGCITQPTTPAGVIEAATHFDKFITDGSTPSRETP